MLKSNTNIKVVQGQRKCDVDFIRTDLKPENQFKP